MYPKTRLDTGQGWGTDMERMTSLESVKHGILGGLVGGFVFGSMMWNMGLLSIIGSKIGLASEWAVFVVYMVMNAGMGAVLSVLFRRVPSGDL